MRYQADYLFDGFAIIENGFVELKDNVIINVGQAPKKEKNQLKGLLMPGFVNTHCHLELSHMKGKVDTGTGLISFLNKVISLREVDQFEINRAIHEQDKYMWSQGIQAVGDISNKYDTAQTKSKSSIHYYTFVEMFDLLQDKFTERSYNQYLKTYEHFDRKNGNNKSAVPHAPYTVTKDLFNRINILNNQAVTISIHNQETSHENDYFINKSGDFSSFFKTLGIDDKEFEPTGTRSIDYALNNMDPNQKTLFVHNTTSNEEDIQKALGWNRNIYWATCPNANLFIENSLPDYHVFIKNNAKMTIGTDSLTSNWQLSILEEIKAINKYNSYIELEMLLKWATKNGAEALSFDDVLGTFEPGKKPGVILLENFKEDSIADCQVSRLI